MDPKIFSELSSVASHFLELGLDSVSKSGKPNPKDAAITTRVKEIMEYLGRKGEGIGERREKANVDLFEKHLTTLDGFTRKMQASERLTDKELSKFQESLTTLYSVLDRLDNIEKLLQSRGIVPHVDQSSKLSQCIDRYEKILNDFLQYLDSFPEAKKQKVTSFKSVDEIPSTVEKGKPEVPLPEEKPGKETDLIKMGEERIREKRPSKLLPEATTQLLREKLTIRGKRFLTLGDVEKNIDKYTEQMQKEIVDAMSFIDGLSGKESLSRQTIADIAHKLSTIRDRLLSIYTQSDEGRGFKEPANAEKLLGLIEKYNDLHSHCCTKMSELHVSKGYNLRDSLQDMDKPLTMAPELEKLRKTLKKGFVQRPLLPQMWKILSRADFRTGVERFVELESKIKTQFEGIEARLGEEIADPKLVFEHLSAIKDGLLYLHAFSDRGTRLSSSEAEKFVDMLNKYNEIVSTFETSMLEQRQTAFNVASPSIFSESLSISLKDLKGPEKRPAVDTPSPSTSPERQTISLEDLNGPEPLVVSEKTKEEWLKAAKEEEQPFHSEVGGLVTAMAIFGQALSSSKKPTLPTSSQKATAQPLREQSEEVTPASALARFEIRELKKIPKDLKAAIDTELETQSAKFQELDPGKEIILDKDLALQASTILDTLRGAVTAKNVIRDFALLRRILERAANCCLNEKTSKNIPEDDVSKIIDFINEYNKLVEKWGEGMKLWHEKKEQPGQSTQTRRDFISTMTLPTKLETSKVEAEFEAKRKLILEINVRAEAERQDRIAAFQAELAKHRETIQRTDEARKKEAEQKVQQAEAARQAEAAEKAQKAGYSSKIEKLFPSWNRDFWLNARTNFVRYMVLYRIGCMMQEKLEDCPSQAERDKLLKLNLKDFLKTVSPNGNADTYLASLIAEADKVEHGRVFAANEMRTLGWDAGKYQATKALTEQANTFETIASLIKGLVLGHKSFVFTRDQAEYKKLQKRVSDAQAAIVRLRPKSPEGAKSPIGSKSAVRESAGSTERGSPGPRVLPRGKK